MRSRFACLAVVVALATFAPERVNAQNGLTREACTRTAILATPALPSSPARAALDRGNQFSKVGEVEKALGEFAESERLAAQAGDVVTALFASANAARSAIGVESTATIRERLGEVERKVATWAETEASKRADAAASAARPHTRLLIHLARSWVDLSQQTQIGEQKPISSNEEVARVRTNKLLARAAAIANAADEKRLASFALGYRAELYLDANQVEEAGTLARRALILADRAAAPDALYRWYAILGRIHLQSNDRPAALRAFRKAVGALDRLALGTSPSEIRFESDLTLQREILYGELVDLLLDEVRARPNGEERQALLVEARDTLESFKTEELRAYFEDACLAAQRKITPDDVPGTVVLYPVVLTNRVALILSANQELSLHHVPLTKDELDAAVRVFRRGLPNRMTRGYLRAASTIYDALIRPIASSLTSAQTLVVIPGGSLRSIPFAALYDDLEKEFLIEKIAVASAPGLTLTDPQPLSIESTRALVAGISQSVQGYPALESVPAEIAGVDSTFRSDVLLDEDFKTPRFEQLIENQLVGVVHIASHGEFLPDFSKSFILTHDGKLSMDRLAKTIGRTRFRTDEPLELLVLSACETAAGDDRAALGLAGVALQAGARSAVATLWSVNDVAAGRIVQRFYAALAEGHSRAEALRMAQREMIADPDFRHAANWAPFLLISNWL